MENDIISTNFDSNRLQSVTYVGYLGPEATFSHQAATMLYCNDIKLQGAQTIEDIFIMVKNGECEEGIVPVENSYEGSVNITQDLLNKYDTNICGEVYLRIRHSLLSREKNIKNIKRVYSHSQAIAQCRSWLKANMPDVSVAEVSSTSLAAKMASKELNTAAIGSGFAASTYGLNVLSENIEDDQENATRFFIIGNHKSQPTGKDKTSIIFFLHHEPGSLYKCLSVLAEKGINLTRIESRPAKTKNWEYIFFVDLEGHEQDQKLSEALREMEKYCVFLKKLGSYPRGDI
ncbi:MAG: prephenate dehydratase [Desulfobacteraceae bacterium]|jgi:chorismate mutase/prephenate dehydratase